VQILVLVANIHLRTVKTEVEKGSMSTAVGHGLVGPKIICKCLLWWFNYLLSKGSQANIPELFVVVLLR